jgi:hypothetical protein
MKRFLRIAGLLIIGQALFWIIFGGLAVGFSPRLDHILEPLLFAYLPTIKAVELTHHYVGAGNFIYPIFYGLLLGIPIYGIIAAAAVCLIKRGNNTVG